MRVLTGCLIFLTVYSAYAQHDVAGESAYQNLESLATGQPMRTFDNRYKGVTGTPFLYESWVQAILITNRDVEFKVPSKLNLYDDEVLSQRASNKDQLALDSRFVKSIKFILDTTNRHFVNLGLKGENPDLDNIKDVGFFEVLWDGETKLYAKRIKIFKQADFKGAYSARKTSDQFFDDNRYYYKLKDMELIQLKLKKKKCPGDFSGKGI